MRRLVRRLRRVLFATAAQLHQDEGRETDWDML